MINKDNPPNSVIQIKIYLKNLLIKGDKRIIIRKLRIRFFTNYFPYQDYNSKKLVHPQIGVVKEFQPNYYKLLRLLESEFMSDFGEVKFRVDKFSPSTIFLHSLFRTLIFMSRKLSLLTA